MKIEKDFIYFERNGKIDLVTKPEFGSITLKIQDGVVTEIETIDRKKYKKLT